MKRDALIVCAILSLFLTGLALFFLWVSCHPWVAHQLVGGVQ